MPQKDDSALFYTVSCRIRRDQIAALREVMGRIGIPVSEQIRRGIDQWLERVTRGREDERGRRTGS